MVTGLWWCWSISPKLLVYAGTPPSGRNALSEIVQLMEVVGRSGLVHYIGNEKIAVASGGYSSVSLCKINFKFTVSKTFNV